MLKKQAAEIEKQALTARTKMQQAKKDAGIVGEIFTGGSMARMPRHRSHDHGRAPWPSPASSSSTSSTPRILALKADIDRLGSLSGDELVDRASGLKLENQNIPALHGELQKAQIAKEGAMNGGLGRNHPTVKNRHGKPDRQKPRAHRAETPWTTSKVCVTSWRPPKAQKLALEGYNKEQSNEALDKQSATTSYLIAKRDVEQLEGMLLAKRDTLLKEEANLDLTKKPGHHLAASLHQLYTPAKPRVMLNLALGGIVGIMFGFGLAFALEYMDTSVKSLDDNGAPPGGTRSGGHSPKRWRTAPQQRLPRTQRLTAFCALTLSSTAATPTPTASQW